MALPEDLPKKRSGGTSPCVVLGSVRTCACVLVWVLGLSVSVFAWVNLGALGFGSVCYRLLVIVRSVLRPANEALHILM